MQSCRSLTSREPGRFLFLFYSSLYVWNAPFYLIHEWSRCCGVAGFLSQAVKDESCTEGWSHGVLRWRWEQKASSLEWGGPEWAATGVLLWSFIENWPGRLNLLDVTTTTSPLNISSPVITTNQEVWLHLSPLLSLCLSVSGIWGEADHTAPPISADVARLPLAHRHLMC